MSAYVWGARSSGGCAPSCKMIRRWKVLLCGYYGMGNLGDELLAAATIRLLKSCGLKEREIAMLSGEPEKSAERHRVYSIDRWSLRDVVRALRHSETLLLGGGGIFQDSSSFRSPWYYWLVVRSAKLCGCKVWAVGQSVGPLTRGINRFLARNAFRSCEAVSVRDLHSQAFLNGRCLLTDDLVLTLPFEQDGRRSEYFLVNFRRYDGVLEYAAAQAYARLSFPRTLRSVGVAMDENDLSLMREMREQGLLRADELVYPDLDRLPELFGKAAGAFGMRLHFGALSLKAGVPCTLAPYDLKVSDFARRWGGELWSGGEASFPRPWRGLSELEAVCAAIRSDFARCFEKAVRV